MAAFDWHSDAITLAMPVDGHYRTTQNVRRFMRVHCGDAFRMDRDFMQWITPENAATMADVVAEWRRRHGP